MTSSTDAALPQQAYRFVDAPLPGFCGFGIVDPKDQAAFVAVRKAGEESAGLWVGGDGVGEIRRDDDFPGLRVELYVNLYLVAGRNARSLTGPPWPPGA